MKSLKLIAASLLAAASVTLASAQTTIHIAGSTAFRKAAVTSIQNILNTGYVWGGVGGATTGTSQLIFSGTLKSNSAPVIIKMSWKGSESGVFTVSQDTPDTSNPFIANSAVSSLTTAGATLASSVLTDTAAADVCFADTFQASSIYKAPVLVDNKVGIIPFVWVAAALDDATIVNLTHQAAKACLAGNGSLNLFTGNLADATVAVDVVGRDEDSGTRVTAFQESTFGAGTAPTQFQPIGSAGAYSGLQSWPVNTVNGITYPAGHSGYSSGGTLQVVLNDNTLTQSADVISYLGQGDATNAFKAQAAGSTNCTPLTWEGISFATVPTGGGTVVWNTTALFNGQYTFWGYEHLMYRSGTAGNVLQFAGDLVTRLTTSTDPVTSGAGYELSQMNVKRDSDGTPVYNK